jgi:hypothetical protein
MKRLIFLILFGAILCTETNAKPSENGQLEMGLTSLINRGSGQQDMTAVTIWGPSRAKSYSLSGGFSSDFRNEGYLGIKGMFDYRVWPRVTLGLEAGAYADDTSFQGKRTLASGVRASYQLTSFDRIWRRKPWNFYAGISAGALFGAGDKAFKEVEPYFDVHIGARYQISNKWALIGELSSRDATLGLGLKF